MTPCGAAGMAIHLGPSVARRLMRPTRGLGSAPLLPLAVSRRWVRPPIWPCSGWSLPVSLRTAARAAARHRHCGTGPRLTAGGRYPPPCAAELGLSSRHRRVAPSTTRDHPTTSLTDRSLPSRRGGPCLTQPASRADALDWHRQGLGPCGCGAGCGFPVSRPGAGPLTPGRRLPRDRSPRSPARRQPSSGRAARASQTSA